MTNQAVNQIVTRRVRQAKVKPFTCHDLRRSMVTDLLDRGHDLSAVQRPAAHLSPAIITRYDRRPLERQRRTTESVSVPYVSVFA